MRTANGDEANNDLTTFEQLQSLEKGPGERSRWFDWSASLLVEPAEGEDVFGSVRVLRLPLLVRLEKVSATASARQRGSTSTRDVIPERQRLLVWAGQGAWLAGRRAKGFEEWVDLQGLSEGPAADWLRLLPVAAVQGDFLSSSR